ncbi:MAG: phosphohydrolase [candidate division Zixibacteria bacterium CG_4_9_14_3_um_filter_46_8]|nr:MAG: phosphohydrolase [candidate division Zixibacteria bacterium CG_4_9_14_3_um_filter_46_8]
MPYPDKRDSKDRLQLVLEVGQAFNSVIDIDRLLGLIADRTSGLLNSERCSIYVVDSERKTLWTKVAMGESKIEIPIYSGIAGAVVKTGLIINTADAYSDPRFNQEVDKRTGYCTRNMLSGPIINTSGEIIGVIQVLNRCQEDFDSTDEEMLGALSGFAGNALENALLYDELRRTFYSVVEVLAATIDAKHHYTAGHTARVAEYSCGIAIEVGLNSDEIEVIRIAAYLHDYGKIAIRDQVLTKPGRLTEEEFEEMKSHAAKTTAILSKMHFSKQYRDVPSIAGAHHEKYNGSGYPLRLDDGAIPLGARIMAVADVFDALTSDRDYRKASSYEDALALMRKENGSSFDPAVFKAFERYFEKKFGLGAS